MSLHKTETVAVLANIGTLTANVMKNIMGDGVATTIFGEKATIRAINQLVVAEANKHFNTTGA